MDEQTKQLENWFDAVKKGDVEALKQLFKAGVDINATDVSKSTALHFSASSANADMMHWLIDNGADLNAADEKLSTPLHLTEKNVDMIRILLEAGADPNLKDSDWDYPYYFAFYGSMTRELTELYVKHGAHLKFVDK